MHKLGMVFKHMNARVMNFSLHHPSRLSLADPAGSQLVTSGT